MSMAIAIRRDSVMRMGSVMGMNSVMRMGSVMRRGTATRVLRHSPAMYALHALADDPAQG